jgi:hypothetical protein
VTACGKDHPHAVRILARAWIYVIWRCWHDGTAYDPAKHDALHDGQIPLSGGEQRILQHPSLRGI